MSEFSLRDLCCLICCPPFPAAIAAKVAFLPPPKTYSVIQDPISQHHTLHLSERAEWQYDEREKDLIDVFFTRTSRGNQIACFYVKASINPKFTILFSHGNAVDIGQMSSFFLGLGSRLDCNIFGYDYSGYGCSTGSPSEKNLYADINAAWNTLRSKYSLLPEKVILYGQSIGTVPTVDLASRVQCAGVVLHSPLMSGIRVACPNSSRTWCFDPFPSIEKVNRISSKLLVIHGTEDEVIDFSHGLAIHAKCKTAVEPLWVEGAGHNDIELYSAYLERLKKFVGDDMKNGVAVTLNGATGGGSTNTSETGNSGDTGPTKVRGNAAPYLDRLRNAPSVKSSSHISNNTTVATSSNTNNTTTTVHNIIGACGAANVDTMQTSKTWSAPSKNSQQNGVIEPPPSSTAAHPPASNSPIVTVKSS